MNKQRETAFAVHSDFSRWRVRRRGRGGVEEINEFTGPRLLILQDLENVNARSAGVKNESLTLIIPRFTFTDLTNTFINIIKCLLCVAS